MDKNLIGNIVTKDGYGSIKLDYGTYLIKQVSGIDGYGYIREFNVTIDSIYEEYKYSLSSNKLVQSGAIIPPNTGSGIECLYVILALSIGLCLIGGLLKYEE